MQSNQPSYFPSVVQNYGVPPQSQQVTTTYSNPQAQLYPSQLESSQQVVTNYSSYPKLTSIHQISQKVLSTPILHSFPTNPGTNNFPVVIQVSPNAIPPSSTVHVAVVTQNGKPLATISLPSSDEKISNLSPLPLYQARITRHDKN